MRRLGTRLRSSNILLQGTVASCYRIVHLLSVNKWIYFNWWKYIKPINGIIIIQAYHKINEERKKYLTELDEVRLASLIFLLFCYCEISVLMLIYLNLRLLHSLMKRKQKQDKHLTKLSETTRLSCRQQN